MYVIIPVEISNIDEDSRINGNDMIGTSGLYRLFHNVKNTLAGSVLNSIDPEREEWKI